MGVPTFYRWLSVKYPRILKDAVEGTPLPPDELTDPLPTGEADERPNGHFDNLYLDMNGIIHPCSHPEEGAPPSSEDEMFVKIFQYIDRLVDVVKPQQLLYMAIDGVAPRAKMNQQRTRRFKAAAEAEMEAATYADLCAQFEREGRSVPAKKEQWDSNVITPGTPFLDKLSRALHYYINERMASHPLWRKIRVILSDANCPGEGEHKIMDYIRAQRTYPGYNPNLRHCLHGADADLIMLGLATHEAHFYILREMVLEQASLKKCYLCGKGGHLASECTIGPSPDPTSSDAFKEAEHAAPAAWKPLQFLSIPILREYLANEFAFRDSTVFTPDFERCVDDFVLMCFFVGNDFLPHLPSLSIHKGSIDQMILLYQKIRPRLSDYLTNRGKINLSELRSFVHYLGLVEDNVFVEELKRQTRMKQKRDQDAACAAQLSAAESQYSTTLNGSTGTSSEQQSGISQGSAQEDPNFQALKILKAQADDAERKRLSGGGSDKEPPLKKRQAPTSPDVMSPPELVQSGSEDADRTTDTCSQTPSKAARSHEEDIDAFKSEMRARRKAHTELENPPDDIKLGVGQKKDWRYRYYQNKFHLMDGDDIESFAERVAQAYTQGLCWVLGYYYSGVPSWGWFYPFHYAPFASDISAYGLKETPLFAQGKPFTPFQQLMAVLPAQSGHCLPQQYAALMENKDSPIIDFYPAKFKEDPDGKRYKWQWVVLLPFINEKRLLDALSPLEATLNEEQKQRNTSGCSLLFVAESHPLCSSIVSLQQQLIKETSSPEDPKRVPTCTLEITTMGVGGGLECSYTKDYVPGTDMKTPVRCSQDVFPPRRCVVGACWIRCPPQTAHVCALLPGAIPPAPVLKAVDLDPEAQAGRERRFNSQAAKRMIMGCLGRQGIVPREEVDRYFWGNRQRNDYSGAAPSSGRYRNVHSDNRYQAEMFGMGSTGGRWSTSTSGSRYSIEDESSFSGNRSFNARGRLRDSPYSGRGGHGCTYPSPKILRHADPGVLPYTGAKAHWNQNAGDHRSFGHVYTAYPAEAAPPQVYAPIVNQPPHIANEHNRHHRSPGQPQILGRRNRFDQHTRPSHVQGSHRHRGTGGGQFDATTSASNYAVRGETLPYSQPPPFPQNRHYAHSHPHQQASSTQDAFTATSLSVTTAELSVRPPHKATYTSSAAILTDPYGSTRSTGTRSTNYMRPPEGTTPIQIDKLGSSPPSHSVRPLTMKPNWVPPPRQSSVWTESTGTLRLPVGMPATGGTLRKHPPPSALRDPYSNHSRDHH